MTAEGSEQQVEELLKALEEMKENRDELNVSISEFSVVSSAFKFFLFSTLYRLQDKYKRALAENENIRNRLNKQIQETKLFAIQGFCKDLLEVSIKRKQNYSSNCAYF